MTSSGTNVLTIKTYERLTEETIKGLLDRLKKPEDARKFLMGAGIIGEDGQLTEPYRPIPQEPFPTHRQILQLAEKYGLPQERRTVRFLREAFDLWG